MPQSNAFDWLAESPAAQLAVEAARAVFAECPNPLTMVEREPDIIMEILAADEEQPWAIHSERPMRMITIVCDDGEFESFVTIGFSGSLAPLFFWYGP
ncbi:MAG: hypothetical protein KIS96_06815 [Bauldia sp.]|nr:hypothetical protein [Bauldia sp.]